jgi:SAM-dependent methyltransferase
MSIFKDNQDAFGRQLYDYYLRNSISHIPGIIERYDGYINSSGSITLYFSGFKDWPLIERKAIRLARGRVLDIGCGAGRHCLYLQEKGLDVTGIDNSPLAIEVCKQRGVKDAILLSIGDIHPGLGVFDTVLMFGSNFGLFGSFKGARRTLKKLDRITSKHAKILAMTNDLYRTEDPDHLSYHEYNRNHGRMGGQLKLKVRYRKYSTPWFDYLLVSKAEMEDILDGTGWKAARYIDSEDSHYVAVIEKRKGGRSR